MSAKATELMSIRDLLQTYCDVMEEFRKREILRSSNNPVADFSELLFCTAFGWNREGASAAGFDAICSRGLRYQIKGRRLTLNNPSRQLSFIRMYYLWKSQIPGSIFVPLGYVVWNTSGTAVQHTKDSPPWSLDSDLSGPTTAIFHASSDTGNTHGYPTWSRVIKNTKSSGNENDDEDEGLEEQQ
jgi:hypothetical protein